MSPENHDIQDNDATFFPRSNDFILKPDEMFTTSLGGEKQYNYNIFDDFWLVSCSLLNNSINRRIFSFIGVGSQRKSEYGCKCQYNFKFLRFLRKTEFSTAFA